MQSPPDGTFIVKKKENDKSFRQNDKIRKSTERELALWKIIAYNVNERK